MPSPSWPDPDAAVDWRAWGSEAFDAARRQGRPILLYVSGPGCGGLFAGDDEFARWLAETRYLPVRIDPERRPEVARRYAPAGCPSLSVLLATGSEAVRATDIRPANVAALLTRLHEHLQKRPEVVEEKVHRARPPEPRHGLDADEVFAAMIADFDTLGAGFGGSPRFVEPLALAFLQDYGALRAQAAAGDMVRRTLDAMMASPLWEEAGVMVYSHTPDWATPRREMFAAHQAGLLEALARASTDSPRYLQAGQNLFDAVASRWFDAERGVFAARRLARGSDATWWTDPTVYSDDNALMIGALLHSSPALDRVDAARRMATAAGGFLLRHLVADDGRVRHADAAGSSSGLLRDQMLVHRAFVDLAPYGSRSDFDEAASRVLSWADENLWEEREGVYADAATPEFVSAWPIRHEYDDGIRPAGQAVAAAVLLAAGDTTRARMALSGPRLPSACSRAQASAARVLLALETRGAGAP